MSHIQLVAQPREGAGKGVARKLRAQGQIPGVLYGQDSSPILFSTDEKNIAGLLKKHGVNFIIDLELAGKKYICMIADYQKDVFQNYIIHLDLKLIKLDQKVIAKVPVALHGDGEVRSRGGIAQLYLQDITVKVLPEEIPKVINVDIAHLNPGQSLKLDAVTMPDNVERMDPPYTTIVNVLAPRALAAARGKG